MKAKVYATLPVLKMGQLTLYDIVQSRTDKEDFEVFSLADIDSAWDHFVQLRLASQKNLNAKKIHRYLVGLLRATELSSSHMHRVSNISDLSDMSWSHASQISADMHAWRESRRHHSLAAERGSHDRCAHVPTVLPPRTCSHSPSAHTKHCEPAQ
jgi:hypothetical protein